MSNTVMTLKEFHERHLTIGTKDVILDVRNPDEYAEARIKGSVNIPLPQIAQRASELKKYDHIYIHCKKGGRAQSAFQLLSGAGLDNLVCIHDAGMDLWISEGYEVERG
jgi:rhodanese-related sulfurtransferase